MSEDSMLNCLIAFILGWLLCRMMGNGFSVGGEEYDCENRDESCCNETKGIHYNTCLTNKLDQDFLDESCTNSCEGEDGLYRDDECKACQLIKNIKEEYDKSPDDNIFFKKWVNNQIYDYITKNYYKAPLREVNFKAYDLFCNSRKNDSESTYKLCNLIRSLASL